MVARLKPTPKLNDLPDVEVPTPSDNDLFYYDAATGLWKARKLVDADIPAGICRDAEADAKVSAHAALTTGVHGVGNDYVAKADGEGYIKIPRYGWLQLEHIQALRQFCFSVPPYGDILRWQSPTVVEYWNGSAWVTWSSPPDFSYLTDSRGDTWVTIDDVHKKFRLTYDPLGISVHQGIIVLMDFVYNMPTGSLLIQSTPDDWTTTNTRFSAADAVGYSYRYAILEDEIYPDTKIRFEFDIPIPEAESRRFYQLQFLTLRAGGGRGPESLFPYWWDKDKQMKAFNHWFPYSDNAYDLGSNSLRWRLIRGVTITSGKLLFENDWYFEETQDGIALFKPDGSKAQEWK